jgi:glycerol-3-phosphate dehydrogenase
LARDVVRLTTDDRALGEPLQNAAGYLRAEVVYAVTEEGALHLDDVMLRRTRIGVEYPDNGISAATEVAALMAPLLGWDAREVSSEIDRYLRTTGVPA